MLYIRYALLQLRNNPFASKLTFNLVGRLLTGEELARPYPDCALIAGCTTDDLLSSEDCHLSTEDTVKNGASTLHFR